MGAGNPLLRSFDNDRFEPTTYYLDLLGDPEEFAIAYTESGEELPDEERVFDIMSAEAEYMFEDFLESMHSEIGLTVLYSTRPKRKYGLQYPELSAGFREEGILLLEGEESYVITSTDGEWSHLPIGVIPSFKFEDILSDTEFDMQDKREWYESRDRDFDAAVGREAVKVWEKRLKKFKKEEANIVEKMKAMYPTLSVRLGAWTSCPVSV